MSPSDGVALVIIGGVCATGCGGVDGAARVRDGRSLLKLMASDTLSRGPGIGVGLPRVIRVVGTALNELTVDNGRLCRIKCGRWRAGAGPRVRAEVICVSKMCSSCVSVIASPERASIGVSGHIPT